MMAAHTPSGDPSCSQPWCGSESPAGLLKRQVSEIFIKFPQSAISAEAHHIILTLVLLMVGHLSPF